MNFLVDAQLPRRFAYWLKNQGHDAVHTLDLPAANRTADHEIASLADAQRRIVVNQGRRFRRILHPYGKAEAVAAHLVGQHLERGTRAHPDGKSGSIVLAFELVSSFVELTRSGLFLHED